MHTNRHDETTEEEKRRLFDRLVERYAAYIHTRCQLAVSDPERCKDYEQEVLLAIWINLDKLLPSWPEWLWVKYQVRHTLDHLRRANARRERETAALTIEEVADRDAEWVYHCRETIDAMLLRLEPDERAVVTLYLQGYTQAEMAQEMNITHEAMRKRWQRMIEKLKKINLETI